MIERACAGRRPRLRGARPARAVQRVDQAHPRRARARRRAARRRGPERRAAARQRRGGAGRGRRGGRRRRAGTSARRGREGRQARRRDAADPGAPAGDPAARLRVDGAGDGACARAPAGAGGVALAPGARDDAGGDRAKPAPAPAHPALRGDARAPADDRHASSRPPPRRFPCSPNGPGGGHSRRRRWPRSWRAPPSSTCCWVPSTAGSWRRRPAPARSSSRSSKTCWPG